jgi:hypothetical protein
LRSAELEVGHDEGAAYEADHQPPDH